MGFGCNIWCETPGLAVSRSVRARGSFDLCVPHHSLEPIHLTTCPASGLPRNRLLLHGFLTVLVPYIHTRLRNNAMSNAWPEAPSSDRRRKLWDGMTTIESTHTALSLVSFVVFLWNGRCARFLTLLYDLPTVLGRVGIGHSLIDSFECRSNQLVSWSRGMSVTNL